MRLQTTSESHDGHSLRLRYSVLLSRASPIYPSSPSSYSWRLFGSACFKGLYGKTPTRTRRPTFWSWTGTACAAASSLCRTKTPVGTSIASCAMTATGTWQNARRASILDRALQGHWMRHSPCAPRTRAALPLCRVCMVRHETDCCSLCVRCSTPLRSAAKLRAIFFLAPDELFPHFRSSALAHVGLDETVDIGQLAQKANGCISKAQLQTTDSHPFALIPI